MPAYEPKPHTVKPTPRLNKDMLTGKRYELSRDEFEDQHDTREL